MESLHKVGDIVTIKSKLDKGCSKDDYPNCFIPEMIKQFGGRKLRIKNVFECPYYKNVKLYTEDYYYKLDEDEGFMWSDPMFEECEL